MVLFNYLRGHSYFFFYFFLEFLPFFFNGVFVLNMSSLKNIIEYLDYYTSKNL